MAQRCYAECHLCFMLSVLMLSVIMLNDAECLYAEYHYAECHYAECLYAECRGAVCKYPAWFMRHLFSFCLNNGVRMNRFKNIK
jgi:hypothetical protein